ncbi:alpha-glucan family phosphorylase, partial [bacterium]|nr:alpha-glucan family phosphorylase [bacterium]
GDPQHDPIANTCKRLNLMNNQEDPVKIILIPVYLDGNDGVINMEYYDVLAGCDLSIFPSYYEPWGYTPHESAVFSVPTVTSDRGGFGKWMQNNFPDKTSGVHVLNFMGKNFEQTVEQLYLKLIDFVGWTDEEIKIQKSSARQIALNAIWKDFYKYYVEAYKKASKSKNERVAGIQKQLEIKKYQTFFTGTNSTQPRFRSFSVITDLPKEIEKLREISYNLWWTWHSRAFKLFERIDPILWEESNHNPVALLEMLDSNKLNSIIGNKRIMSHYKSVVEDFDAYINDKSSVLNDLEYIKPDSPVAYFSMEIGLHESIRTYSGGLGILSGDHLKVTSDLKFPLIGVSLLYKYGYFKQKINRDDLQIPIDVPNNFAQMPIDTIELNNSEKLLIPIVMPGRVVYAQVWKARVGRINLYYLETDIEENSRADRDITSRLYEPRSRERIEQEIILGIGGVKLLNALGIEPSIYHLNEGHSAFLLIERIRQLMQSDGLDFYTAKEVVKSSTVFTMHTPVPAGNERFDKSLVENYFRSYIQEMGITWDEFWNLGHIFADDASSFTMTVLAIKLSNKCNAVSKLHQTVSRNMWKNIWPGLIPDEIPIQHVTNGVHVASWMSHEVQKAIESFTGISCEKALLNPDVWEKISEIPNTNIWQTHKFLKDQLFELVKQKIQINWTREGVSPDLIDRFHSLINPNALTIGFARRFATYKRQFLLFHDFERFKKIISDRTHSVQFIFAGKAHPADKEGADLITKIVKLSKQDEFLGKIIFLEGYNINAARNLVAGVDVWLNTPVRPLEASGTSGMKASLNGVINCSILDGWWDEAYNCENGWAIGTGKTYENPTTQNNIDSDHLYNLLEEKIIPTYYSRNEQNIPDKWIDMMKKAMISIIPVFNAQRMLREYIKEMYEPTAAHAQKLTAKKFKQATELASWKKKIASRFSKLKILEVRLQGLHGDVIKMGTNLSISVRVECGDMQQDEFIVELFTLINGSNTQISNIPIPFARQEGNNYIYEITYTPEITGTFQYGVRVIPYHPSLDTKYETGLVYWS